MVGEEAIVAPESGLRLVVGSVGHAALAGINLMGDDGIDRGRSFGPPVDVSAPITFSVEGAMPEPLTEDEHWALSSISQGLIRVAAGRRMFRSEGSVKHYLKTVFKKLNAQNAAEAVTTGIASGSLRFQRSKTRLAEPLTVALLEVGVLAAFGFSNEKIALRLPGQPSASAAKQRLQRLMAAVDAIKRPELVLRLFELGIFVMQAPGVVSVSEESPGSALVDVAAREDYVA